MDRDDVPATEAEQEKAAAFGDEELVDAEIGEEQGLGGAPVAMSGSDPARTHLGSHGIDTTGASTGGVPGRRDRAPRAVGRVGRRGVRRRPAGSVQAVPRPSPQAPTATPTARRRGGRGVLTRARHARPRPGDHHWR